MAQEEINDKGRHKGEVLEASNGCSYTLDEKLGEGGLGEVWKAAEQWKTQLGTRAIECAVKFLRPELDYNEVALKIMQNEAEALASLSTVPYFVRGKDFDFQVGGGNTRSAIRMDYVSGGNLEETVEAHIAQGYLVPVDLGALWMQRASKALAMLHDKGIIHRDIKPQNILLNHQGVPMLTDIGLAIFRGNSIEGVGFYCSSGYWTPEFLLDPESGRKGTVEEDMFTLGLVGYYLLTGVNPMSMLVQNEAKTIIKGESQGLRMPIKIEPGEFPEIVPPHQYCQDVPEELSGVIMGMLAAEPRQRPLAAEASNAITHYMYDMVSELSGQGVGPSDEDSKDYLHIFEELPKQSLVQLVSPSTGAGKFYIAKLRRQLDETGRGADNPPERICLSRCLRTLEEAYGITGTNHAKDFDDYRAEHRPIASIEPKET